MADRHFELHSIRQSPILAPHARPIPLNYDNLRLFYAKSARTSLRKLKACVERLETAIDVDEKRLQKVRHLVRCLSRWA